MQDSDADPAPPAHDLADYLGFARAHADTSDTRQHVSDLEAMLQVAWDLMTPDQRNQFRTNAEIQAVEEAVGGGSAAA